MVFGNARQTALFLLALCIAGATHAQDSELGTPGEPRVEALSRAAEVLETEEVIETLRAQLATLSKSALNLRIPDVRGAKLFKPQVRVTGLGPAPSTEVTGVLDLGVMRWHWPVDKASVVVDSKDVDLQDKDNVEETS